MTPDEVLAVLDREANHAWLYRLESYAGHSEREMAAQRGKEARTAVAALIARNAELEAASIGRDLGEVHALIAENAALTAERDALRETVGLFADDAQRLEFLIDKEVIPHKMGDTGLYMLIGADHYPYNGEEHDTPREAIDDARAEAGHG